MRAKKTTKIVMKTHTHTQNENTNRKRKKKEIELMRKFEVTIEDKLRKIYKLKDIQRQ